MAMFNSYVKLPEGKVQNNFTSWFIMVQNSAPSGSALAPVI